MQRELKILIKIFSSLWYVVFFAFLVPWLILEIGLSLDWLVFEYLLGLDMSFLASAGTVGYVTKVFGLSLIVFGIIVFIQAWVKLARTGGFFPLLTVSRRHLGPDKLVTTGLYRQVRHPMFLGYAAVLLGLSIYFRALFGIIWVIPLLIFAGTTILKETEEKELLSWFGEEYKKYQEETPLFFPRLRGQASNPPPPL